jgi:hypothetical protein
MRYSAMAYTGKKMEWVRPLGSQWERRLVMELGMQ